MMQHYGVTQCKQSKPQSTLPVDWEQVRVVEGKLQGKEHLIQALQQFFASKQLIRTKSVLFEERYFIDRQQRHLYPVNDPDGLIDFVLLLPDCVVLASCALDDFDYFDDPTYRHVVREFNKQQFDRLLKLNIPLPPNTILAQARIGKTNVEFFSLSFPDTQWLTLEFEPYHDEFLHLHLAKVLE